jgi:sigma-E factor negative regulatory protein RseC
MEQLVRVRETFGDGTALVIHIRESACSGDCHKCSGCGAAKETVLLKAKNPIGARRGDLVKLESATGPVLKAAAVMYMIPMLLFFAGYFVGDALWQRGALIGCLSFVAAIGLAVLYDRIIGKTDKCEYTITGFVEKSYLNS